MTNTDDQKATQFGNWQFNEPAAAKKGRRARLIKYLSRPLVLEEAGPPAVLRQLIYVTAALVAIGIAWAAVTKITETAITRGQIMPAGALHLVEHLEGGIVKDVLVEDGQFVEKGDVILRLESAEANAELDRLRAREAGLALRAARLRSFVTGRTPDFSIAAAYPELVADQRAILELQQEAKDSQLAVLRSRIDQRKLELAGLVDQRLNVEEQIEITEAQVAMRRGLVEQGLDSRVNLLDSERRVTEIRGELVGIVSGIASTRESLHEAEGSRVELEARVRNDALAEMGEVAAELAEVRESLATLEDRVRRLEITAPVSGIVKGLLARTVGGIVGPGEPLMEVVPLGETMVAEIQIRPEDIGHMVIGQPAKVKVTAYDVALFGALAGKLQHISASTFQDDEGEPYYKGVIALAANHVGPTPGRNLVLPGMVVNADISTGRKTLLQYLLKPVYRALDSAFGER